MKAVFVLLCVGAASAERHVDIMALLHKGQAQGGHHFDILAALHGHHKKKNTAASDPTSVLGKIMAATQQGLALAEMHHEKAVKSARDELETALGKQGDNLATAIREYDTTVAKALSGLEATKNATDAVLQKHQQETAASTSWNSAATAEQAHLSAHISFIERELRKDNRKRGSSVREAISSAKLNVEDGVDNLGLKLGDITDLVTHAQDKFSGEQDTDAAAGQAAFVQSKIEVAADLKSADAALMEAKTKVDATIELAKKRLATAMDQVQKYMAVTTKSINEELVAAQKEEYKQVRGGTSSVAMPSSLRRHKKP